MPNSHQYQTEKTYAFVDGTNLYLGAKSQGINLHYGDLRLYLRNRLDVDKVFLFIGYDSNNVALYKTLQGYGYILIFKPTITYTENGKRTMKDFTCLIKYLKENDKLAKIITPTEFYSSLFQPYTSYILPLRRIKTNVSRDKQTYKNAGIRVRYEDLRLVRRGDVLIVAYII